MLDTSPSMDDSLRSDIQFVGVPLDVFDLVSVSEIRKIITKSCELDPIPTSLLKQCLDSMLPIITEIINRSFFKRNRASLIQECNCTTSY
jgi:hypothetical protein